MLGLPDRVRACLFDLDGVLTPTAAVHAAAWKQVLDAFLSRLGERTGVGYAPFDLTADYDTYVDGKPRADGARSFLRSRGVELAEGTPADPADAETVSGLGRRKDQVFREMIARSGVQPYPGSVRYLSAVRAAGLRRAVVSSSTHCVEILAAAGLGGQFDAVVDGRLAQRRHLAGKPAPDTYLAAARELGIPAADAAVFEDALAGVAAGRAGNFGCVIGVDRAGQAEALRGQGADIVVGDLAELLVRP